MRTAESQRSVTESECRGTTRQGIESVPNSERNQVRVYIDVPNICRGLSKRGTPRADFKAIMYASKKFGVIISAKAFVSTGVDDSSSFGTEGLARALEAAGFEVRYVPLSHVKETRVDQALVAEMLDECLRDPPDSIVLVSGDSDYFFALCKLRAKGINVVVVSLDECLSAGLGGIAQQTVFYENLATPVVSGGSDK